MSHDLLAFTAIFVAMVSTLTAYVVVRIERENARHAKTRADWWSDIAAARGAKINELEAKIARMTSGLRQNRVVVNPVLKEAIKQSILAEYGKAA